jgi:hypothetical protein
LFTVTDLARLLPRHWDGRRLMRFLAGLAMIAAGLLAPAAPAVTAAAPAPVVAGPAAAAATTVDAAASREVRESDETEPVRSGERPAPTTIAPIDLPAGTSPAAYGSRGPPVTAA